MTLTDKERAMLFVFLQEGINCNGSVIAAQLLEDNMTCCSATDLCGALGWNKQEVGGVMASLSTRGLIEDSGDSARGARDNDWFASDRAIETFFDAAYADLTVQK
jgi:hypothetical protein